LFDEGQSYEPIPDVVLAGALEVEVEEAPSREDDVDVSRVELMKGVGMLELGDLLDVEAAPSAVPVGAES
jgi:hypothetical protein